jgi:LysM repeat protein
LAPAKSTPAPRQKHRSQGISAIPLSFFIYGGLAAAFLAGLLLVATVLGWYTYYQSGERIVPGVRLGAQDLSGLTVDEATLLLDMAWNNGKTLQVTDGLVTQPLAPADLGLSLNSTLTARKAYAIGHGQSMPAGLSQMIDSLLNGRQVPAAIDLDIPTARQALEALRPAMSKPAQDATIRLDGVELVAVPSQLGYTINLEETLAALIADPARVFADSGLQVKLMPVLPAIDDATPYLQAARQVLDSPPTVQAYDQVLDETYDFPLSRQEFAAWLAVEPGENGPQIGYDPARIAVSLSALGAGLGEGRYLDGGRYADSLAQAAREGRPLLLPVSYSSTSYVVQPGDTLLRIAWNQGMPFWRILQANPGMDPEALPAGQAITIPARTDLLPLPVVPGKRIVISIEKQRLWAYENGELARKEVISTGMDRSPTQPGIFQVQTHDPNAYASVWDLTMPNFLGIYEAWPGFMNGIHGLPVLSNGRRLWANVLGQPASYGCIILDLPASEWLYNWAEDGVVVEIQS